LAHTKPLFTLSKILPLEQLIVQAKLQFMHSIEYGYGQQSFLLLWQKNFQRNPNANLRNADDFYIPTARVDSFKRIPMYSLPLEWNNLPIEIKAQFNKAIFKRALREYLFEGIL
jgi:hypothetical protein